MAKDIILEDKPTAVAPEIDEEVGVYQNAVNSKMAYYEIESLIGRIRHCSTIQQAIDALENEYQPYAEEAIKDYFGLSNQDLIHYKNARFPFFDY